MLLGMDFFEMTETHVDVQNRELLINGEVIPCRDSAGRKFCCRVFVRDTVTIPPCVWYDEKPGGCGLIRNGGIRQTRKFY